MKVNLIVTATGPNNGRAIPIIGAKFLIGRDPQCHLRPASQAVSKMHCAILIRDGKVFAEDFGSTNGTQVNDEPFTGERELHAGDSLKIGPLEFKVEILASEKRSDSTPLPDALKPLDSEAVAKLAAAAGQVMPDSLKPSSTIIMQKPAGTPEALLPPAAKTGSGSSTAAPTKPAAKKPASTPGVQKSPVSASGTVPSPLPRTSAPEPVPIPTAPDTSGDSSDDIDAAAMLLGMDDDPSATPQVPDGSTVYDMPAVNPDGTPAKKPEPKKKTPTGAEMSAAANDILRKYIRRTGN